MTRLFYLLPLLACLTMQAQSFTEWQDPQVNQVNRLPSHANFFAYESAGIADKTQSERYLSLEGMWKFAYVENIEQRPTDFFKTEYNDAHWDNFPVPGLWEKHGYGDPLYVNIGYAWLKQYKSNPPIVPSKNNHVGSYRRWIDIPETWNGEQIIAHFGSVTSCMYLWANGKYVGYSEDSKIAAEFDITRYIKPGRNLIALQVQRWCDGTYLEDQDFFRFSGIARECYLYSRSTNHIDDILINARLDQNYKLGTLDMQIFSSAKKCQAEVALNYKGEPIASKTITLNKGKNAISLSAGEVKAWTAETPELYDVCTTLKDAAGKVIEVIPLKAGFRDIRIEGGQLKVNGKAILIKGADRHEIDPDGGYVVSVERMLEDIKILKGFNFNAVRTCHYPDDPRWYELCDRYGIYLVAEANIESHGMGFEEETLAIVPSYKLAHLERNQANVKSFYNHPSVIIWSLGNESGNGSNFEAAYDWIKEFDPNRPVQYEGALGINDICGRNTDIFCPMYFSPDHCERYAQSNPTMPLIQCEYAHAMGNSMGGFKDYWDLIRKYPHYQGGFIWDFVDQGQRKIGKNGVMIYGYGGDWNPYDASDFNFCDNGLISPDRVPNPHMYEVRYQQQSIWAKLLENGKIELYNEYDFRDLSNVILSWELLSNGIVVRKGNIEKLDLAAGERKVIEIDYGRVNPDAETLLNLNFTTRRADGLLEAGHRLAYQQLTLNEVSTQELKLETKMLDRHHSAGEISIDNEDAGYLIISSALARIDFSRKDGLIRRYEAEGRSVLAPGAVIEPNFWRAPTDNDFGANLNNDFRVWRKPVLNLVSLESKLENGIALVTAQYTIAKVGGALCIEYCINNAGEIIVKQSLQAGSDKEVPDLFRFGMRMKLPADLDRLSFYGRGPWENYTDRKSGAMLGIYNQSVEEQAYPYIRPQETGTKSDLRWLQLENISHNGLRVEGAKPFLASALNYSQESLDEGKAKHQMHSQEVRPCKEVWLVLSAYEYGLGCVTSWGALPLEQYRLPYQDYEFEFVIRPI